MVTETLTNEYLVKYVLERVPVHVFNRATKSFSVQPLYHHVKREMLAGFEMFGGSNLTFAVKMADAFRQYNIVSIAGEYPTDIRATIDMLRAKILTFPTMHPTRQALTDEYNAKVSEYNAALKPQNKLIRLYKKLQKSKTL